MDSGSTFYRVRLNRNKEKFNVDKLFDTLELAIAFLAECKTPEGRKRVMDGLDNVTQSIQIKQIIAKAAVKADPNFKEQLSLRWNGSWNDKQLRHTKKVASSMTPIYGQPKQWETHAIRSNYFSA
ncbi:hypothetical protein LPB67_01010 [Undibacterium sp. Jales W-56]|nr:hypothetical protein [Undibacterium sp. Jales W-56]MCU6432353.1 hypothetical protein [Undibacterium sp. Jales W-56]